jgi:hypothetical protein
MNILPQDILDYIFNLMNINKWKDRYVSYQSYSEHFSLCQAQFCKTSNIYLNFCDNCSRLDNPLLYFIFGYRLSNGTLFRIRVRYINGQFIEYDPRYKIS